MCFSGIPLWEEKGRLEEAGAIPVNGANGEIALRTLQPPIKTRRMEMASSPPAFHCMKTASRF